MRRLSAFVLALLFALQAPASAGPITGDSVTLSLSKGVQPLLSMMQSSWIFAVMTGQAERYAHVHAGVPPILRLTSENVRPPAIVHPRLLATPQRQGVPIDASPQMKPAGYDRRQAPPDPLVISARSTQLRRAGRVGMRSLALSSQSISVGASTTGIHPWWQFEEKPLAGVGKAIVNVTNGNFAVIADDLSIPERGIGFAMHRVYNSQSTHDQPTPGSMTGTDGAPASIFGNGFTNNFDTHLGYDAATGTMSVYDLDGARDDYSPNPIGCSSQTLTTCWKAPAGMQGTTLQYDGNCGYWWTKKSGTSYYMWSPLTSACAWLGTHPTYAGRLYQIQGRNHNNTIGLVYWWNSNGPTQLGNLTTISVVHGDGARILMNFAPTTGNYIELSNVTMTDGTTVLAGYGYDSSGNLQTVTRPGNSSYANLTEEYWYVAGTHEMQWVAGPRYMAGSVNNGNTSSDGSTYGFSYDANSTSGKLTQIGDYSLVNFTPSDGSGTPLQAGATGINVSSPWRYSQFTYTAGETQFGDSQGHRTRWYWYPSGSNNIAETDDYTGAGYLWLVTYAAWDSSSNNLVASTDARGDLNSAYVTNYSYDASGNTIEVQQPSVTTSQGVGRPTARYVYDSDNNLVAYCDPKYEWPSGTVACAPGTTGVTWYQYDTSDVNEPFGKLTDTYTPTGYHHTISYDANGMPTQVQGQSISQSVDASTPTRTPTQTFHYDPLGNLLTYNTGNGTWTMSYDNMNRPLTRQDADGVMSYMYYNNDGSVSETDTAYQKALGAGHKFAYDADGNVVTQTAHNGGGSVNASGVWSYTLPAAQVTSKYYDGEDRLVEVVEPYDASNSGHEGYTKPWITRYLYDLTKNGTQSFNGSQPFLVYGNLFETQELLPSGAGAVTIQTGSTTPVANTVFQPMKGNAFDALDRPTQKYTIVNTHNSVENLSYDADATSYGLLNKDCSQLNICKSFTYDNLGRAVSQAFSDGTPTKSFMFFPRGELATASDTKFGQESFTYDNDGHQLTKSEQAQGGVTSPATITHEFYADGTLKQIDVSSSSFGENGLFVYGYRPDGAVETEQINVPQIATVGTTTLMMSYKPSGRITGRTEAGPAASGSESFIYDSNYGFKTGETLGAHSYTGMVYDAEGNLVANSTDGVAPTSGQNYTVRGELVGGPPVVQPGTAPSVQAYANGTSVGIAPPQSQTGSSSWDDRMGLSLGTNYNNGYPQQTNGYKAESSSITADADGRVTQSSSYSEVDTAAAKAPDVIIENVNSSTTNRSYDALNHVTATTVLAQVAKSDTEIYTNSAASYGWGVDEHPLLVGVAQAQNSTGSQTAPPVTSYDTLHWDGGQPLFETDSAGRLDQIFIGTSGTILPRDGGYAGLTWFDRNPSGTIAYCRNATGTAQQTGYASVSLGDSITMTCNNPPGSGMSMPIFNTAPGTFADVGSGGVITMPRTDGISDGINVIQGVRTYDPQVGAWTTPDAYQGDVHDPSSQKSYMWNGNNPVSYSDPSGYYASLTFDPNQGDGVGQPHRDIDAPEEQQAVKTLVDRGQTSSEGWTLDDAAFGAGYTYRGAVTSLDHDNADSQGTPEVGAGLYSHGAGYGFGDLKSGYYDKDNRPSIDIEKTPDLAGMWHAHPSGEGTPELWGHIQELKDAPWLQNVYTTVNHSLYKQYIVGGAVLPAWSDSIPPFPPLCKGCL